MYRQQAEGIQGYPPQPAASHQGELQTRTESSQPVRKPVSSSGDAQHTLQPTPTVGGGPVGGKPTSLPCYKSCWNRSLTGPYPGPILGYPTRGQKPRDKKPLGSAGHTNPK